MFEGIAMTNETETAQAIKGLLFDAHYIQFLAQTHPQLALGQSLTQAPFFMSRLPCYEVLRPGIIRDCTRSLESLFPSLLNPRALVFGLPFEPYEQTPILEALPNSTTMKKLARDVGADMIFLPNISRSAPLEKLYQEGFFNVPSFPDMRLSLNVHSFKEYLNYMPSKYRRGIQKNIRIFEEKKYKLIYKDQLNNEHPRQFYEAYCFMRKRARVPWIAYEQEYFVHFHTIPQSFIVAAFNEDDEFLGMAQGIQEGCKFHIARVAARKEIHRRDSIFFRLIYATIEHALHQGCTEIIFAPTSYALKRRLGARPSPLYNLILPISFSYKLVRTIHPGAFRILLRHLNSQEVLEKLY